MPVAECVANGFFLAYIFVSMEQAYTSYYEVSYPSPTSHYLGQSYL